MNYKCDGRTTFFQYSIIIVLESHVLRYTCAFRVITCLSRGIDIYSLFTRSHFFQNRKGIPPLHIFLFCMYNLNVISFTQKSMLLYWNRVIYNAISKNIPDNPSCTGVSSHFSSTNEVKQSSIFQLPQKRFDHCVKYKK